MVRVYGHRWTSGFGDADDGTWLSGLRGLTPEDIANGYRRMIESGDYSWPPSLPEFRGLCFGINDLDVRTLAELEIRREMGSFDFNHLTTRELEKRVTARMSGARKKIEADVIAMNLEMRGTKRLDHGAEVSNG